MSVWAVPVAIRRAEPAEYDTVGELTVAGFTASERMSERFDSVDALLEHPRTQISRYSPAQARERVGQGALLVDIRPQWQRSALGEIPGSLIIEANHLLWRLHPGSGASLPQAHAGRELIIVCQEGYSSSLNAASLAQVGLPAGDLDGGVLAWADAGFPVSNTLTEVEQVVGVAAA